MKKLNLIIALLLTMAYCNIASAQLTGWPSTTNKKTVANGEIVYLDSHRVGITAVTANVTDYNLTINTGSLSGTFLEDDFCLLISMEDGNLTGLHKSCVLKTINNNIITVTPNNLSDWNLFTTCSKLQLIKVPVYDSLTLNHGQITCHPYNETTYTGGVLAFVCDTFVLNAGYINATGQGISPYTMNLGIPGLGGAGSQTYYSNSGGLPQTNTPPCYTPDSIILPLVYTLNGTEGDSSLNNGGIGTSYNYSTVISNSTANNSYPKIINMGTPGVLGPFTSSSTGGSGGGHGGKGRNLNNSFIDGNPGEFGANGEDPQKTNSRGGGIIIAKIKTLYIDNQLLLSGSARFISNGGNGTNGGQGGFGGNGGAGGIGEEGFCTGDTIFFSGAKGGYGEPGDPGNGGDGTNGGQSGSIWYLSDQQYPVIGVNSGAPIYYNAPFEQLFNVNGGKGGKGGVPGISEIINHNRTEAFDTTGCNPLEWCVSSDTSTSCDCDSVFAAFQGEEGLKYNTSITPNYVVFGNSIFSCAFDSIWGVLKYAEGTKEFYCPMSNPKQFKEILKLIGIARLSPYQNDPAANVEAEMLNGKLRFQVKSTKWPIAEYDFESNTLTDLDDPAKQSVVETSCLYSSAAFGGAQFMKVGSAGDDGNDYPYSGSKSIGTIPFVDSANVIYYSPVTAIDEEMQSSHLKSNKIKIYPNPAASTEIQVESEIVLTEICILDHLGKIMIQLQPNDKQLLIPIQSLPDAMYTIQLKTLNETITKKIVILKN